MAFGLYGGLADVACPSYIPSRIDGPDAHVNEYDDPFAGDRLDRSGPLTFHFITYSCTHRRLLPSLRGPVICPASGRV